MNAFAQLVMFGRKAAYRLQAIILPSPHQRMLRRWDVDRGDYVLRFDYDLNEDSVVFDLGGYAGQWTSDLFARYRCRVYVFEPVRAFAEQIRARFHRNDRIEVFPYGLAASSRHATICVSADASSIFGTAGSTEEIELVDARDWITKHRIGRIHLMKINIEGGEYELLERLIDTGIVANIDDIQVQFHAFNPGLREQMKRVQHALAKTHEPTYQYDLVWENWRRKQNNAQTPAGRMVPTPDKE